MIEDLHHFSVQRIPCGLGYADLQLIYSIIRDPPLIPYDGSVYVQEVAVIVLCSCCVERPDLLHFTPRLRIAPIELDTRLLCSDLQHLLELRLDVKTVRISDPVQHVPPGTTIPALPDLLLLVYVQATPGLALVCRVLAGPLIANLREFGGLLHDINDVERVFDFVNYCIADRHGGTEKYNGSGRNRAQNNT